MYNVKMSFCQCFQLNLTLFLCLFYVCLCIAHSVLFADMAVYKLIKSKINVKMVYVFNFVV